MGQVLLTNPRGTPRAGDAGIELGDISVTEANAHYGTLEVIVTHHLRHAA